MQFERSYIGNGEGGSLSQIKQKYKINKDNFLHCPKLCNIMIITELFEGMGRIEIP